MTGEPLFKWEAAPCDPRARSCDVPGVGLLLVTRVTHSNSGRRREREFDGFVNGRRAVSEMASMETAQRLMEDIARRKLSDLEWAAVLSDHERAALRRKLADLGVRVQCPEEVR